MRHCLAALAALALAGCAGAPATVEHPAADRPLRDAAPVAPPPGLAELPDPAIRADPATRRGNIPYEVFGKRYEVLETPAGYDREGIASWYGAKFHANETTSGERYDMYKLTAAHRSLPIPTYARVTNLDNGKSTLVRVNDRGPFHPERIIDLSYAAAVKLDFHRSGTARVRVQTLRYFVHAGTFAARRAALAARDSLAAVVAERIAVVPADDAFRVRIGPLATRWDAERLQALLAFREQPTRIVED